MLILDADKCFPYPAKSWRTPDALRFFIPHLKSVVKSLNHIAPNLIPNSTESDQAVKIFTEATSIDNPKPVAEVLANTDPATLPAGTLLKLDALLTAYDHVIIDRATKARNYLINRLIIESDDNDPKVRLKALELLGKTAEVGAFSERVNVQVTHRTVQQIDVELSETLQRYLSPGPASLPITIDAVTTPTPIPQARARTTARTSAN